MRLIPKKFFAVCLAALLNGAAWAASFTASLDRDTLTLGEQATLSLNFEGGQPSNITMPKVPGLEIIQVGNNSFDFNGNQTSTLLLSVQAGQAGEFTIPAVSAEIHGQKFSSQPLKLTVSKAAAPSVAAVNSGNEVALLKLNFPKPKVFSGESAVAQLELYLRDDVQNIGNFQLTGSATDGFSAGKTVMLQNQQRRIQAGNRTYTVIPVLLPLTAVKTGALTLGPFTANVVVVLPGGFFGEQRQVTLATEAVNVQSQPLPEEKKPANFTGAVGSFTMSATAGPTTVTVGDPVTVRVQISGRGSLDSLTLPAQEAWQNFKTYPPTSKLETSDQFGFQGAKTFEQIVSPLNNDVHELPALTFAYFNPEDGQYHTLKHPAVPLTVRAAGSTPLPTMAGNKNPTEEKPVPDILPIKENFGTLTQKVVGRDSVEPLIIRPVFLAVQAVPVLAFLAAFIWRKRTDNLANNPRLRRQRAVAQLIRDGLNDLKKFAGKNKSEEFFALLFRLIQEQLGERLDCPATAITESVIDEHPALRGAPPATRAALHELFQLCNQARYAPVRGTGELNSVAAKFEQAVGGLQEVKA